MSPEQWLTIAISLAALVLGIRAEARQHPTAKREEDMQKQQIRIQQRLADLELARESERRDALQHTTLTAYFIEKPTIHEPEYSLVIRNRGPGIASTVKVRSCRLFICCGG
jgi:hypothetical protein